MAGMRTSLDIAWIHAGRMVGVDTLPPAPEVGHAHCPRTTSPGVASTASSQGSPSPSGRTHHDNH